MNFANGQLLWLLLVVPPALVAFLWWSWRERRKLSNLFIQARLLPGLITGISSARRKIRYACLVLGVAMAIIALARPQWGFQWDEVKQRGLDIIVAIDTSKSMLAEDIAPNRLARAKLATLDLMQQAKSDRLGLVAFAGGAFLQCPLTIDDTAFRQSVDVLDVTIIPQGGTAIAEAINTALTAFKEENNYKVLVLITDGEDNDQGALEAARNAAKAGLRIFTIGIGTAEGALLRFTDAKGNTDYVRDEQGNVVMSRLNEPLLQQIAGVTEGGFYLPLRGAKTIDALYERGLAPLPKSEGKEKLVKRYHERFHWPLAAAIVLLLAEMLLPERKRETRAAQLRSPGGSEGGTPSKAASAVAAVILLFLLLPGTARGSPSSALREYKAGNYGQSLKEYESLAERKTNDLRLHFNAGAAAYRNGQFDEAAKHFTNALPAQDLGLQERAYYNLGNALYRAGESAGDPKKTQASWEGALKQFDSVLQLNTNNADAKFNYEFVKQRLEELKQQQQPQPQNQNQQDQEQKDRQQDSAQQDQQKQDQQQAKQDQKDQQQQPPQSQQKQDRQEQDQQAKSSKGQEDQERREPSPPLTAHQMTPQEAQQLLDAQKGDEMLLQFKPQGKPENRERTIKDW